MALVPRKKKGEMGFVDKPTNPAPDSDISTGLKFPADLEGRQAVETFSDVEITSFHEQAIDILNKLEEQGVNIYDETRTPGMYLKTKTNENKNISQFFEDKINKENKANNNNDDELDDLFNFFDKK